MRDREGATELGRQLFVVCGKPDMIQFREGETDGAEGFLGA
jgi:hypothetical protein